MRDKYAGDTYRRKIYIWLQLEPGDGYDEYSLYIKGISKITTNLKSTWDFFQKFYPIVFQLKAGNLWDPINTYSKFCKNFRMAERITLKVRGEHTKFYKIEMHTLS